MQEEVGVKEKVQKITVDRQLRIQESYGDLLQRHLGETLKNGQQLNRRLLALGWPDAAEALGSAVKQGKTMAGEKIFASQPLVLQWLVEPLVEGESVKGAVISFTEITWEKRRQRQKELGGKMGNMAQFAHQIVHRLNNPLAAVLNQIGCLLMDEESGSDWPKVREDLAGIQEQIYALAMVTHALDAFSREEGGSGKLVQLNAILEKAVEISRLLNTKKAVHLSLNLSQDQPIIYANEIALEQCFLNVLRNAIEASPETGEIIIRSERSDGMAVIAIQDSGAGIAADDIERAFEPFFTTKYEDHLGLGLSISYSIAAHYNGFLEMESAPGGGTLARLMFPIAKSLVQKG
jgi:signal transduction histidine kinase